MNRLLIAAVAFGLTGGVALAQNTAPQGDYVNHGQNGASSPAPEKRDLRARYLDVSDRASGMTATTAESDQTAGGKPNQAFYPGSFGGR